MDKVIAVIMCVIGYLENGKWNLGKREKPIKVRINMDKLAPAQVKIVEYLLENKKITNKEVQELLEVKIREHLEF